MAVRQIIRVRGVKGLSENNQTLRRACPERDSSVASLLQNDKGEGLRVTMRQKLKVATSFFL
jgi:hypothetical protein